MSIAKTVSLSLAAVVIFAAHSAPSSAEGMQYVYTEQGATDAAASPAGDDEESLWDYIMGWL
jgi:hypothetical protein